ncbi:hypothetical protein DFH09DRAFT_1082645 [Mycena vulgaris]|nr:hypothetical protein DFH09DRAFT_1082645 [Mycena vulgaris]
MGLLSIGGCSTISLASFCLPSIKLAVTSSRQILVRIGTTLLGSLPGPIPALALSWKPVLARTTLGSPRLALGLDWASEVHAERGSVAPYSSLRISRPAFGLKDLHRRRDLQRPIYSSCLACASGEFAPRLSVGISTTWTHLRLPRDLLLLLQRTPSLIAIEVEGKQIATHAGEASRFTRLLSSRQNFLFPANSEKEKDEKEINVRDEQERIEEAKRKEIRQAFECTDARKETSRSGCLVRDLQDKEERDFKIQDSGNVVRVARDFF